MVAIKSTHLPLTARDLWPDLPWDWEQESEIRDRLKKELEDSGKYNDPTELYFAEAKAWEDYLNRFPRIADRQRILAAIYPRQKSLGISLTEEELNYLRDRLYGSNEELGQIILKKLELTLSSK